MEMSHGCMEIMCASLKWKCCMEILCGSNVWNFGMGSMYRNCVWISCMEITDKTKRKLDKEFGGWGFTAMMKLQRLSHTSSILY